MPIYMYIYGQTSNRDRDSDRDSDSNCSAVVVVVVCGRVPVLGISSSAAGIVSVCKRMYVLVCVRTKARVIDELPLWLMDLLLSSSTRSDTIEKPRQTIKDI